MVFAFGNAVDLVVLLSVLMIVLGVCYGLLLLWLSRFDPKKPSRRHGEATEWVSPKTVIFVIPCLNEDRVLGASLARLLELDFPRMHVVVIDDGSEDRTAEIVGEYADDRIHLLQRALPNARQGKGEALNAALRHVVSGGVVSYDDPDDVIICVIDADGRLESHSLDVVVPMFAAPTLGAVQIGVRINNRSTNLLARMQDVEFVLYTQVFQRGRRHLGSVGLGGNGQFVRLSALTSLGERPWSRSLTEDLDLGVRLLAVGWKTDFASSCAVHQQGLGEIGRWVKQRTRWFQGHVQSWPLVPMVLRNLRGKARADLTYHLTSPFLILTVSFLSAAFLLWFAGLVLGALLGDVHPSWWWLSVYLVAFGPALMFGLVYSGAEGARGLGRVRYVALMHVYVAYAVLWFVAGWKAVWRILTAQNGWAKTDRTIETVEAVHDHETTTVTTATPLVELSAREHSEGDRDGEWIASAIPPEASLLVTGSEEREDRGEERATAGRDRAFVVGGGDSAPLVEASDDPLHGVAQEEVVLIEPGRSASDRTFAPQGEIRSEEPAAG